MKKAAVIASCLLFPALAGIAKAQQATNSPGRPHTEAEYITLQLRGDDSSFHAGLDRINVLTDAGVEVSQQWLVVLIAKGMYPQVEALALKGMVNGAQNCAGTSSLARTYVMALVSQGKNDQALAAAKAYYNVAGIRETEVAVRTVAQCLDTARPNDPDLLRRFKTQQVEWSTATTRPDDSLGDNVLFSIKVPSEPFTSAAASYTRRDVLSLMARGNLLLLADQPAEARKAFESAQAATDKSKDAAAAVEGVARAIRAQAGALGPANAYIVAQQKTLKPVQCHRSVADLFVRNRPAS